MNDTRRWRTRFMKTLLAFRSSFCPRRVIFSVTSPARWRKAGWAMKTPPFLRSRALAVLVLFVTICALPVLTEQTGRIFQDVVCPCTQGIIPNL